MKKMKELLNTKNKRIIALCVLVIVCAFCVVSAVYIVNSNKTYLELKKDTVTVEYGKTISMNAKDYLVKDTDQDIIKEIKVTSKVENEKDKTYPAVGSYKVTLTYKDEKVTVKVLVKDTTKPVIEGVESIDMVQETDLATYDFNSLFTIADLSQIETKFDTSKIDVNIVGDYTLKVVATDKYKNKTELKVPVKITEKPVVADDEELVTEIITDSNGQKKTIITKKKKPTISNNQSNNTTQNSSSSNSKPTNGNASSSSGSTSSGTTQPPVQEICYTDSWFIGDFGLKYIKGVDYIYDSWNWQDCENYIDNVLGGCGGYADANLPDGRIIYYVYK